MVAPFAVQAISSKSAQQNPKRCPSEKYIFFSDLGGLYELERG